MSSSRSGKQKRCNEVKSTVVEDMHDLVLTSGMLRDEVLAINEDFVSIFKSMADRQSELLSQWIGINEKYGALNDLLKGNDHRRVGESSQPVVELPTAYIGETHKFLDHSYTSLDNHANQLKDTVEEMVTQFDEIGQSWTKYLSDLKEQADELLKQKDQLRIEVYDFKKQIFD